MVPKLNQVIKYTWKGFASVLNTFWFIHSWKVPFCRYDQVRVCLSPAPSSKRCLLCSLLCSLPCSLSSVSWALGLITAVRASSFPFMASLIVVGACPEFIQPAPLAGSSPNSCFYKQCCSEQLFALGISDLCQCMYLWDRFTKVGLPVRMYVYM